jgi:hypothetical protein
MTDQHRTSTQLLAVQLWSRASHGELVDGLVGAFKLVRAIDPAADLPHVAMLAWNGRRWIRAKNIATSAGRRELAAAVERADEPGLLAINESRVL